MGPTEGIIILIIVLVLFGPTLVAFFMGYSLGKKRATPKETVTMTSSDTRRSASPPSTDTTPSSSTGAHGVGEEQSDD